MNRQSIERPDSSKIEMLVNATSPMRFPLSSTATKRMRASVARSQQNSRGHSAQLYQVSIQLAIGGQNHRQRKLPHCGKNVTASAIGAILLENEHYWKIKKRGKSG